ncbi:hypothetical protein FHX15_003641 [Rhizobium sp. BK650]|uniref:ABC-three component system middle component 2 n=1 Tax=Rhizobium sp. BK650 TaxID=2586990 RepID=UPI001825F14C|nr:ABC-three component system middle component 2 [Rhizobium sp. BK650]MBB3658394.1 hypothetical protein [Rhizobium sp. BK650]
MRLFNTPLEAGFRMLFILSACRPEPCDLQRLISYDYLLVHSGDVSSEHDSLHPAVPNRGSEWVVKRDVINMGLGLMFARDLVEKRLTVNGIHFAGSELTTAFVRLLTSPYAEALRVRSRWLAKTFGDYTDDALQTFMSRKVGTWGAEFDNIAAIKDIDL